MNIITRIITVIVLVEFLWNWWLNYRLLKLIRSEIHVTYIEKIYNLTNHVTDWLVHLIPGREILGLTLGTNVGYFSCNLSLVSPNKCRGNSLKKDKMIFFLRRDKRNCTFKKSATGTLFFTDEQVIISITEDNMQKVVYKSN